MTGVQHPGQRTGLLAGASDRELWALLSVLVAHRPVLSQIPGLAEADRLRVARVVIARTVREVGGFADELAVLLLPAGVAPEKGTARGVALSLVRLCRAFVHNWSDGPVLTVCRVEEFNQELEMVVAMLDSVATRFA